MRDDKLELKLASYYDGEKAAVIRTSVRRDNTTLDEIRDAMFDVGVVLEEDLEQGIYVARITGGRRKAYGPIIAATPSEEGVEVAGVVMRGKKKPVLNAMHTFEDALAGNSLKPKRRHMGLRLILLLMLVSAFAIAFSYYYFFPQLVIPARAATVSYNEAVDGFNAVVPRYNAAAEGVSVDNLRGFVQDANTLSVQGTDYFSICRAVLSGNNAKKIENDAATVRDMTGQLESDIPILEAINNPSEDWVISKLQGVDGVDQVKPVTANNDPNMMLGKEGGYSSCVYFTTGLLGKDVVAGSTPVEKGVDGGGAVEVYPTLVDAQARCDYLAEFDDTILYSGSYALVGTMVIRTSCLLDDEAQYAMTNNIVTSMVSAE